MVPKIDPVEVLGKVSLFKGLHPRYLKAIFKTCTRRVFAPGDCLVEQGNSGVGLFIIQSGMVKVEKILKSGSSIEISKNGPGDVIGEMSVLDGASRTASVIAIEEVTCLVLSSWGFKAILESHPEVALGILPVVVQRFRETSNKLIELGNQNPTILDSSLNSH